MVQFVNPGVIPVKIMLTSVQWAGRLGDLDDAIALFRDPSELRRLGVNRIYFPAERQPRWSGDVGFESYCCLSRSSDNRWYLEYTCNIASDALICIK